MSGDVVAGLVAGGILLVVLGVAALMQRGEGTDRRLRRWAEETDLAVPPELAAPLAARLRREALTGLALAALLAAPALGLVTWLISSQYGDSTYGSLSPEHGPTIALLPVLAMVLAEALTRLRGIARQRRAEGPAEGPSRLREVQIALRDVVPGWVLWTSRGLTAAIPVVATGLLWNLQRQGYAPGYALYTFGPLLLLGLVLQREVETRQIVVLNRRQPTGTAQARAVDDAFRVRAVLSLVPLVPLLAYLAGCVLLQSVYADVASHSRSATGVFENVWAPLGIAVFAFHLLVTTTQVRRYYRGHRHLPPAAEPPTTENAPC